MKKIIYYENPDMVMCESCEEWIENGFEAFWHGEGKYTCSKECANKFEKI